MDQGHSSPVQKLYESCGDYFDRSAGHLPQAGQAASDLAAAATDDGRHLLGIFLEESLVGVLDLRLADPGPYDVHLGLILLLPSHRGQGLGSWALLILEEWLRQATPTEAVVLNVYAPDHLAQRFFLALGYAFTGQASRVLTGSRRARLLVMRKALRANDL